MYFTTKSVSSPLIDSRPQYRRNAGGGKAGVEKNIQDEEGEGARKKISPANISTSRSIVNFLYGLPARG